MLAVEMLSEPVIVPDIYVTGLHHVEDLGNGNYRLVFFTEQRSPYGEQDMILTCRLVADLPAIITGVKMVMKAIGYCCCGAVARKLRH